MARMYAMNGDDASRYMPELSRRRESTACRDFGSQMNAHEIQNRYVDTMLTQGHWDMDRARIWISK